MEGRISIVAIHYQSVMPIHVSGIRLTWIFDLLLVYEYWNVVFVLIVIGAGVMQTLQSFHCIVFKNYIYQDLMFHYFRRSLGNKYSIMQTISE